MIKLFIMLKRLYKLNQSRCLSFIKLSCKSFTLHPFPKLLNQINSIPCLSYSLYKQHISITSLLIQFSYLLIYVIYSMSSLIYLMLHYCLCLLYFPSLIWSITTECKLLCDRSIQFINTLLHFYLFHHSLLFHLP